MMDATQSQLILDLVARKVTDAEFLDRYPVDPRTSDHVTDLLAHAVDERDADGVEYALLLAFRFGFPKNSLGLLNRLLIEPWHTQHENIALALKRLKDPSSVDSLYEAALANHPYLEYDEAYALAVKCIWALAAIGNDSARQRLRLLAESSNKIIRESASEQLHRLTEKG